MVRLLPLLVGRGLNVGTVKHSTHPHPLDKPRSDSLRHRDAGAGATLVIASEFAALHFSTPENPAEAQELIARYLGGFDLVLVEGWNEMPGPKIEILPADAKGKPDLPVHFATGDLMAAVYTQGLHSETRYLNGPCSFSGANSPDLIPCYHWVEIEAVTDLIQRWMAADVTAPLAEK